MPTTPYLELDAPRHSIVGDASDHTRYVKLMATVAPYINNGVSAAPTLGWKSPALSTQARLVAPVYGILNGIIPNRK